MVFNPDILKGIDLVALLAAFVALFTLIWQVYLRFKEIKYLAIAEMNVRVDGDHVFITCCIKNAGSRPIYPNVTNLYLMEGIETSIDGNINKKDIKTSNIIKYDFEKITEHRISEDSSVDRHHILKKKCNFDCVISEYCKNNCCDMDKVILFPKSDNDVFSGVMKHCINLRMLSRQTLIHILPNESFYEDVAIKIKKPGLYRAFMIYTDIKWKDCTCRSVLFRIKGDDE